MRNAVKKLERAMEKSQHELADVERRLADGALYEAPRKAELTELLQTRGRLQQQLSDQETEWLEKQEALEKLEL